MRKATILLAIALFALLAIPNAHATFINATIINATNGTQEVFYSTSANAYVDGAGNTPDVKLRICATASGDLSGKKASLAYAVGVEQASTLKVATIAGDPSDDFVSLGAVLGSGSQFCADTPANFNILTAFAKYPAKVYAIVDENSNNDADSSDSYVFVGDNGKLPGTFSITISTIQATYSQATGNISVALNSATANTGPSTTTAAAGNTTNLQIGVCDLANGTVCNGTATVALQGSNTSLFTGVVLPADTTVFRKQLLLNGFNQTICIGPDLQVSSLGVSPSSPFSHGKVNISVTATNGNNVNATRSFNVSFWEDSITAANFIGNSSIAGLVRESATAATQTNVFLPNKTSGAHTVIAKVEDGSFGDCDDTNDQTSTAVSIQKSYNLIVKINEIITSAFPHAGRPFNVSITVNDSDGVLAPNITVKIVEENGLSVFAPVQDFNLSDFRGLKSVNTGQSITDAAGNTKFTIIPTGNKLFNPEFAYLNLSSVIGNYILYIEIFDITTNAELQQFNGTDSIGRFDLTLTNLTARQPNSTEIGTAIVINQDLHVKTILTFINQALAAARKWSPV